MRRALTHVAAGAVLVGLFLVVGACADLKASRPILPIREYEKMLVGSLEADYIGNDKCLRACHVHDQNALYLKGSVHGRQVESGTGMPLVNCESCHGPGSLAVAKVAETKKCDTTKFIPLKTLPAAAQSLLCLKCHSSHSMANMQYWAASQHAQADVSCSHCHKLHKGPSQKLEGTAINELCYTCHPEVRMEASLFSRHPLKEGKMSCASCHEPHGSISGVNLTAPDIRGVCIRCHADKVGPYTFEHADLLDDCGNCHQPHGSPFAGMLLYQEPFLCLQCHPGHTDTMEPAPSEAFKRGMFTKCSSCHSQIHGTDTRGDFPRSRFLR